MGSGSSSQQQHTPKPHIQEQKSIPAPTTIGLINSNRKRIVSIDHADQALESGNGIVIDSYTMSMLQTALTKALFLNDTLSTHSALIESLVKAMQSITVAKSIELATQGVNSGGKLHIIEHGTVEVVAKGSPVVMLSHGDVFGESSMYINHEEPMTARTASPCQIWVLTRGQLTSIQKQSHVDTAQHRLLRLNNVPELGTNLSAERASRLVSALEPCVYAAGESIYKLDEQCERIVLIESGSVKFSIPKVMSDLDQLTIMKNCGVHCPPEEDEFRKDIVKDEIKFGEGCVVGIAILRGKAGLAHGWPFVGTVNTGLACISLMSMQAETDVKGSFFTVQKFEAMFGRLEKVLHSLTDEEHDDADAHAHHHHHHHHHHSGEGENEPKLKFSEGLFSRIQVFACTELPRCSHALADYPLPSPHSSDRSSRGGAGGEGSASSSGTKSATEEERGCGQGRGTGAVRKQKQYVLKILDKNSVDAAKQTRHVLEESAILRHLDHPFIGKLAGRFQTPSSIVFVLESYSSVSLLSRLDQERANGRCGLDFDSVRFYIGSLILALGYLRKRGVVYRNLRPENIMLDFQGCVKLVGFGIAKKVPFKDSNPSHGKEVTHFKTYTLCGSVEFMAPEILLNKGHDHSADKWSLGVLLFELLTGTTPFASSSEPETTGKIMAAYSAGVVELPAHPVFEDRDAESICGRRVKSLIEDFLVIEPSNRLSIKYGDLHGAFGRDFFLSPVFFDWESLALGHMPAPSFPLTCQQEEEKAAGLRVLHPQQVLGEGMPEGDVFRGKDAFWKTF